MFLFFNCVLNDNSICFKKFLRTLGESSRKLEAPWSWTKLVWGFGVLASGWIYGRMRTGDYWWPIIPSSEKKSSLCNMTSRWAGFLHLSVMGLKCIQPQSAGPMPRWGWKKNKWKLRANRRRGRVVKKQERQRERERERESHFFPLPVAWKSSALFWRFPSSQCYP